MCPLFRGFTVGYLVKVHDDIRQYKVCEHNGNSSNKQIMMNKTIRDGVPALYPVKCSQLLKLPHSPTVHLRWCLGSA